MNNQSAISQAAASLGSITSDAKAAAARANGIKGGRPRTSTQVCHCCRRRRVIVHVTRDGDRYCAACEAEYQSRPAAGSFQSAIGSKQQPIRPGGKTRTNQ